MSERALQPAREPVELSEVRATRAVSLPTMADVRSLLEFAGVLVKSGLLPETVRTPEAAAVILLKGQELGIPPMAALEGIQVIKGKATIGAHLMLALVKRAYGGGAIWVSESTPTRCTISYRIPGQAAPLSYAYTIEDARTAGLAGGDNWRKHPSAMLRARCISATCKLAFPEVVGGLFVAGELPGTAEIVTEDGDVIVDVTAVSAAPREEPPPARQEDPPRRAAPHPDPEPIDAETGPAELPLSWVLRLEARADELPVVGHTDRPGERAPGPVKAARLAAMRRAIREVSGQESRKHLTPEQATRVGQALIALRAELDGDGAALEPVEPAGGLPVVDAEPIDADGEAGNDRFTRG